MSFWKVLEIRGWKLEQAAARNPIQSYEDLDVYQRSLALIRPVHDLVKRFPDYEDHDLVQQMRRASKSVPANIAEGFSKRRGTKDFKLYLAHALGSANEMLVHLRIAAELDYVPKEEIRGLTEKYEIVCRQMNKLIQNWR
jgi:four helix bundle protein